MRDKLHRRRFLAGLSAAGSGAAVAAWRPACALAQAAQPGQLTGKFVLQGEIPARKNLPTNKEAETFGKSSVPDESLVIGPTKGVANIFVYLRTRVEAGPALAAKAPKTVVLDNKDWIFQPHCLTIWRQVQQLKIVNSDPVAQNIAFAPFSEVPRNIVVPVKGTAICAFHRSQATPIPVACNFHPWESAYILPRDNPFAVVSDASGVFRITDLPVGKLEFQLWHERVGFLAIKGWPKGRATLEIKPGVNDMGEIPLTLADLP